jgi:hypothetical protein
MLRCATSAIEPRGRRGLLLALLAIAGQLLIAGPHEVERAIAACAVSAPKPSLASVVVADSAEAARSHNPAQCPTCQAAAHGRSALGSAAIAHALPLAPSPAAIWIVSADVPGALDQSTASPRAPPA